MIMSKEGIRRYIASDTAMLAIIALGKLILNIAVHGRYGYFRDELYYIACSNHLAWGYVDQPPLSIFILKISRMLLGDSLYGIRFTAALAGAIVVVLTGLMVKKLGGRRFAQGFAALGIALSPVVLGNGARYFSMNAFDLLFWALAGYIVIAIIRDDNPHRWILFGVTAGLGLLNKYSMLFLGFGLVVGLLLTQHRKHLISKWFWIAGLLAVVLFLPHVIWQVQNGYPSLEFIRRASHEKNIAMNYLDFTISQFLMTGFIQSIFWLSGLYYFFFHAQGRKYRFLGWMYLAVFAVIALNNSKAYYLTPVYPMLLAGGCVLWEKVLSGSGRAWRRSVTVALMVIFSLLVMPFTIPVLPVESLINYYKMMGITPKAEERSSLGVLPQYYADMFGWEEFTAAIAGVYQKLTPDEQAHCVIFVRNYGEAGAIDFFGKKYGLPKASSGHNNYWLWGPPHVDMKVAIILGNSRDLQENFNDLAGHGRFEKAELAATTSCRYCMPYENDRQIFLCRKPTFTFTQIWSGEKNFI
jgi:hypothetical protein